ncbi:hypothetical protein KKA09_04235 [Patescibacteria group bacterium]|nr:hypothetical protein [Patescibacteria group bacterium]
MSEKKLNWKKHFLIFLLTSMIFGSGFLLSNFLLEKKIVQLTNLQQDLIIDILSLETQFSLLTQTPCGNLNEPDFTEQLRKIAQELSLIGNRLGEKNLDFLRFKKYYSILEIKNWLLLEKAAKDCKIDLVSIIYFYSDEKECPKCQDQQFVLNYIGEKYPFLRIYSFDYNLELSALRSLKSIYSLTKELPIIIINNKTYYGFLNKKELEEILNKYAAANSNKETTTSTDEQRNTK